jgi:phosphatidylserine/phosphatidylglycerophosphate/cardiolipin synthase-like enzyme
MTRRYRPQAWAVDRALAARRGGASTLCSTNRKRASATPPATSLLNKGLVPLIDVKHTIAYKKEMAIDGRIVLTGSFNFTNAAEEKNAENLLVVEDATLAKRYADNWADHAGHSRAYARFVERGRARKFSTNLSDKCPITAGAGNKR